MTTTQQYTFTLHAASLNDAQRGFNAAFWALQEHGDVTFHIKTVGDAK